MRRRIDCLLVASGKGGVGTSIIAALMALTAAERGKRVLLIDACESGGSLHHLFGVRPTHSLWMLSHPRIQASDALVTRSTVVSRPSLRGMLHLPRRDAAQPHERRQFGKRNDRQIR